jgi:hypothetical protein
MIKTLERTCALCGKKLTIIVNDDKTYSGGHFFNKLDIGIAEPSEYWECDECYNSWPEEDD